MRLDVCNASESCIVEQVRVWNLMASPFLRKSQMRDRTDILATSPESKTQCGNLLGVPESGVIEV